MSLASSVAGRDFFDLVKAIGINNDIYIITSFFTHSHIHSLTHLLTHSLTKLLAHLPGESKSKQEEDRIVSEEVQYLKKIINGTHSLLDY